MKPLFRRLEGLQPYAPTLAAMQAHATAIRSEGAQEAVWLLEHEAVYTAGTSARDKDLLNPGAVPTERTGRGGQWTWHGPGQRVAYVMLDLQRAGRSMDIRGFVCGLEGWIIDVLDGLGVTGQRRVGLPGIWVETGHSASGLDKIAAIGVRVSRWVTWHGIAINNRPDLDAYRGIVPCGVSDAGVTSLAALGVDVKMEQLDALLESRFARHFTA